MNEEHQEFLLPPYRVLDLTDEKGFLCAKLLGDFGADVIKIEKPGGDPSRSIGPFYHDIPDPEKSLFWFAFNVNKKGITLNLETRDGREIFKRLVKTSDLVIESFQNGYMDSLGLGYSVLININPGLIMTSITPFGRSGPYKDYLASDLVLMAMSGAQYLYGDPDRPPVRISFPQAYLHAAGDAFAGSMIALYHREMTGEGQYVDVSAQESTTGAMFNALPFWDMNKVIQKRMGTFRAGISAAGVKIPHTWRCKDGFITFIVIGGMSGAKSNKALTEWMKSEGMTDDFIDSIDWNSYDFGSATQEFQDRIHEPISIFFKSHTKQELFEGALKRGIMLYPINSMEDIANDPQLEARGFWEEVEHPEQGVTISYPGALMKSPGIDLGIRRRAPLIGEHNLDIYEGELGFSRDDLIVLKQAGII